MDEAFGILLMIGVGAAVLFGPWVLLWRSHRKRLAQRMEDQARWADLTHRIHLVEQGLNSGAAPAPGVTQPSEPAPRPVAAPPPIARPEPLHIPGAATQPAG